jgi:hypothetical protein
MNLEDHHHHHNHQQQQNNQHQSSLLTTPTLSSSSANSTAVAMADISAHSTPKLGRFSPERHHQGGRGSEAPRTPTPFKRALAEVYRGREPLSNTPQTPTKRVEDITEIIKKDLEDLTDLSFNRSVDHQVLYNSAYFKVDTVPVLSFTIIPDPDFYPESRISDPTTKEEREKLLILPFFRQKFHKIQNYFILNRYRKTVSQLTKNYSTFLTKNCH